MSDETLQVAVEDVLFRSGDGRFAVIRASRLVRGERGNTPIVLVGDLAALQREDMLRVRGHFEEHRSHGTRFRVASYLPILPTTEKGLVRFLGSVEGVGEGVAKRIVDRFGARTLDVITQESGRLKEVHGVGKKRAGRIAHVVKERRDHAEQLAYMHSVGLGPGLARKIMERYGERSIQQLQLDPYLVAEQVSGIGFTTADAIGRAAGIADSDPRRASGALLHVLAKGTDQGHVYLPRDELLARCDSLQVPRGVSEEATEALAERGLVVVEGDAVYPPPLYRAEVDLAKRLNRLAGHRPKARRRPDPDEGTMAKLAAAQRDAVYASLEHGLVVLTGGPGTGKTTTVRAIVEAFEKNELPVVLCAPTGRAAKRLSEATGRPSQTIHRLLEWNPGTARFQRDESSPLEAALVLVDESSMLDLRLASQLVQAVPPTSTLVLVGDVDQLPPVGAGQVLREILTSGAGEVVRLTEVFRQAQESAIVQGAHAILRGEKPSPTPTGTKGTGDLFLLPTRDVERLADRILRAVLRMGPSYGLDPKRDVQVLSPMRKGPVGTERLNLLLQGALNPEGERVGPFRAGDRVMQLRNNYDKDVFNGDMGEVRHVEGGVTYVSFDGRDVQYSGEELDSLTLAYASTIHKVQGSEFPAVLVALHAGHHVLLSRALLYTAVTRARRLVVLAGDDRALGRAVANAETYRSYSALAARLSH